MSTNDVTISSCNYDCMCTSSIYEPVCGADDLTYFSPCRAGCMKRPDENDLSVSNSGDVYGMNFSTSCCV